ncbi:alpha/beta hydrolase [Skermania sp. ID1734]|nr:alpha/beta hydrolase [Skermania sp. ID1734]
MTATKVSLAGVTISYRDSGGEDPHPVLLVHGMGGDGHTWDRFAADLVHQGRRVIIADLRGHGRSAHTSSYIFAEFADDLHRLCDGLELRELDMVGHSLGGYAVSLLAQQRPDLVRRVVIEECPLPRRTGDPIPMLSRRLPTWTELWHAVTSAVRHPRALIAFDRSMTTSALQQFRQPNQQWWDQLADIEADTLILVGGPGGMVDPVKLEIMHAAIPSCEVIRFKTGHSIHRDRYRDFAAAVMPFLMRD